MANRPPTLTRVARALAADPATLSDRDLLIRFVADGDQAAFAAVAARHTGMVLGVCRRALPRAADAEDACQAVFLLLAEKAGRIRWQGSVAGWLYTVARRVARNARLSAERRARRETRAAVPEAVAPVDTMTGRELAAILDEELGRLPPRYRDPLVLCCLEGLTQDEAAARLGVPIGTLRSQLKRGRKKLADALSARGCELGIALLAVTAAAATAAPRLMKSIQAAAAGSPSPVAVTLARGSVVNPLLTPVKSIMLAATVAASALGLGAALTPPTSAQPPKDGAKLAVEPVEAPAVARFGGDRFRAGAPIGDARYSPDGKRIVGFAGGTIYVWDTADGAVVRTIDTRLRPVPEPGWPYDRDRVFAAHPKDSRVAFAGLRGDKTILQVWDYETGKLVAEAEPLKAEAVKALAWTPDGTRLLERSNSSWITKGGKPECRLIVREGDLTQLRNHDLPRNFTEWGTVVLPLPGSKEVILWQSGTDPTVFNLDTGRDVRPVGYTTKGLPSGLALSPDGKTLAVTCTEKIALVDFASGEVRHFLPVRRGGWEMPRPMFSPDGRTVYVFDFGPMAYDVATGKEKWKGVFSTVHSVAMHSCALSPDGSTLVCVHGHWVARIDTATGTERDPPAGPSRPAGITWSPDGTKVFTRAGRTERTWTAWDVATGQRLYHLAPTGFVPDNEWKVKQDLFFIHGGKDIVAVVEKAERNERSAAKELLVFDTATGKCLRRLGGPLPTEQFRWLIPVAVEPDGSSVVFQNYTVSALPGPAGAAAQVDTSREYTFATMRWDPAKQTVLRQWVVTGNRTDVVRHFGPYSVTLGTDHPDWSNKQRKQAPARIRLYALADGRLAHQWETGFSGVDADRVQGNFLLATGYDSEFVTRGRTMSFSPKAPFAYDVWELPSRQGVRVFETNKQATVVLGPQGQYVLRVNDDGAVEVHEPFVLKKAVAIVSPPARPAHFEFSPDGGRVAVSLADTSIAVWDTAPWVTRINAELAKAVPEDLTRLWGDLAGDAATGLRAARLLGAAADKGVTLLKAKVPPRQAPDAARVAQLIADLDSSRFAVREKAEAELRDLGGSVEAAVRKAQRSPLSAEAGKRIENVLAAIESATLTTAQVRELRAVQALAWMGTPAARELLAEWAKGDPAAPLTRAAKRVGQD